jgi:uncharacterized repeat protein (TIGR02543 family)
MSTKRTGAGAICILSGCICCMILLIACSSPFRSQTSKDSTTGLKLSFLIQGPSVSASAKGAKLLLPTVRTLKVYLTPVDTWLQTPASQTATIGASDTTVSASFASVQYGNYTITAQAFDSSGTLAFRQSSPLTVSAATVTLTLNLVPVDVNTTDLQLTTAQSYEGTLSAGEAKTWAIPSGTSISSSYGVRITADPSILFFAQDSTGAMINTDTSARTITASQAAGSFLTLYNPGTTTLPIKFVLSAVSVVYDGNGATSGITPTDLTPYVQGATVLVVGNLGALARSGYTFNGWNTAADGSGTAYAPGATFAIGTSNIVLYAQWSKQATGTLTTPTTPASNTVTISGPTVLYYGNPSTFTATYSGAAGSTYAWYLDVASGTPLSTSQTFAVTPTLPSSVWTYGSHTIMAVVQDALTGIRYSTRTSITVTVEISVMYDPNGALSGLVPVDRGIYASGATATVLGNTGNLSNTGSFKGWNTASDGSGTGYTLGQTFVVGSSNVVLYAQWNSTAYSLRDTGPAGGYIFYINPNYVTDGWRYLEAAPNDTYNGISWDWGSGVTPTTNDGIGAGKHNTAKLVAALGTANPYAALKCVQYNGGGCTDWFMPSLAELNLMYANLASQGSYGFEPYLGNSREFYASSTGSSGGVSGVYMYNGAGDAGGITNPYSCRAIREF